MPFFDDGRYLQQIDPIRFSARLTPTKPQLFEGSPPDQVLGGSPALLTLTATPGALAAGAVNLPSQPATLTLTAMPGSIGAGTVALPSQVAQLSLTAVPGALQAAASLPSQTATLVLTAVPGQVVAGAALLGSQTALFNLTATPGTVLSTPEVVPVDQPSPSTWQGVRHGGGLRGRHPRAQQYVQPKRMRVEYGLNGEMYLLEADATPDAALHQPLPPQVEVEALVVVEGWVDTTADDEMVLLLF